MTTGQLIKHHRLQQGLTQDDLAAKTDLTARTIQRIENDEVVPRAYTLKSIAVALSVDFEALKNTSIITNVVQKSDERLWLALLHLTGLLFLLIPPLIIWYFKNDELPNIKKHAVDVVNFQLNVLACIIPCGIFAIFMFPILILIAVVFIGTIIIIINSIKVFNGQSYRYPLLFKLLSAA